MMPIGLLLQAATTQPMSLDATTWVPLGVVCTVGLFVIGMVIKAIRQLDSINSKFSHIDTRLNELTRAQTESWTVKDQTIWELRFKVKNPSLGVPNAQNIAAMNRTPGADRQISSVVEDE